MQLTAGLQHGAGVAIQGVGAPSMRDRAQQCDERCRGGHHHIGPEGVLEQVRIGFESGGEHTVGGNEQHHELGGVPECRPVGLPGETIHVPAQRFRVCGAAPGCTLRVRLVDGVEVGVHRCFRIDRHLPITGQVHHEIR